MPPPGQPFPRRRPIGGAVHLRRPRPGGRARELLRLVPLVARGALAPHTLAHAALASFPGVVLVVLVRERRLGPEPVSRTGGLAGPVGRAETVVSLRGS